MSAKADPGISIRLKPRKKFKKKTNDITIREIISLMTSTQDENDKKLQELVNYCIGK